MDYVKIANIMRDIATIETALTKWCSGKPVADLLDEAQAAGVFSDSIASTHVGVTIGNTRNEKTFPVARAFVQQMLTMQKQSLVNELRGHGVRIDVQQDAVVEKGRTPGYMDLTSDKNAP